MRSIPTIQPKLDCGRQEQQIYQDNVVPLNEHPESRAGPSSASVEILALSAPKNLTTPRISLKNQNGTIPSVTLQGNRPHKKKTNQPESARETAPGGNLETACTPRIDSNFTPMYPLTMTKILVNKIYIRERRKINKIKMKL